MKTIELRIPLPVLIIGTFCAPIFIIGFTLPAFPQTDNDIALNEFLDDRLFGLVGFWSSLFPFSSKAAANYVATTGPLIFLYSIYMAITVKADPNDSKPLTSAQYLALAAGMILLFIFLTWIFYFRPDDLGTHKGKYGNLFGSYTFLYSFHQSLISFLYFFFLPFCILKSIFRTPLFNLRKSLKNL
ncbi:MULTISPECIES: hypothetical protein [unclassified Pseudomonas]|uniref:hypothetical protein n=1 Tax=unclassified Pseudomonas TaxID=196821 RepID=UPI000A1DD171|nr:MULTISPECIES: hypothetical protein [unclassified Pseudomonas]